MSTYAQDLSQQVKNIYMPHIIKIHIKWKVSLMWKNPYSTGEYTYNRHNPVETTYQKALCVDLFKCS